MENMKERQVYEALQIHSLEGFRSAIDTARNGYAMQKKIGNHIQQNRIRSP